jgi:segregation and condensation protein B
MSAVANGPQGAENDPVSAVGDTSSHEQVIDITSSGLASDPPQTASRSDGSATATDLGELPGLRAAIEAVLLIVDTPVSDSVLAQVLERPRDEVARTLQDLAASYIAEGRGFELREVAGGWRLYTSAACAPYVERFVTEGQPARLTQASLETLAVVAYRQPVSRARVSAVRGVNVEGVMRTLTARGLIEEVGSEPESGAILYGTTTYFLERLGLSSLEELPELAPFLPEIEALEADIG